MQADTPTAPQAKVTLRGFKLYTVLDRLALDVLCILQRRMQAQTLDKEALCQDLLQLLQQEPYKNQLLFRDFNQKGNREEYSFHSWLYLQEILVLTRLKPANSLKGRPGNMLLLLQSLCQQGAWQQDRSPITIARRADGRPTQDRDEFFSEIAQRLQTLCIKIAGSYGEVAKGQREKYGPLMLFVGACCAEVPEELSFFETIETPLLPLTDGFANDPSLQKIVVRVLAALNERYMLLRNCGLNPDQWLDRGTPSIHTLKEMKRLRTLAGAKATTQDSVLYRQAFNELRGDKGKFAGYASFDEFALSEAGQAFLLMPSISLDELTDDLLLNSTTMDETEEAAASARNDQATLQQEWMNRLLQAHPKPFRNSLVMTYFFRECLEKGIPLTGDKKVVGILDDPQFIDLLSADPKYAGLDNNQLAKKIHQRANTIIQEGKSKCRPPLN